MPAAYENILNREYFRNYLFAYTFRHSNGNLSTKQPIGQNNFPAYWIKTWRLSTSSIPLQIENKIPGAFCPGKGICSSNC